MIETFAALAEPNRLRIVELLRKGPRSVGEIGSALGVRQPQVSKHLKHLKEAGLVDVEARAQERIYGLRGAPLLALHQWLEDYRALWSERFDAFDAVLAELQERERPRPPTTTRPRPSARAAARSAPKPAPKHAPKHAQPQTTAADRARTTRTSKGSAPAHHPTRRRP